MKFLRKRIKLIASFLLFDFALQIIFTSNVYAITGHAGMPEYRSFEPVSTTNMVNPLNGDFTYNISLLEIPNGYPINISYHSGDVTNEAQSSWVGLGFTLNPGAINRNKRGVADDVNGDEVTYHTKMPSNWNVSLGVGPSVEAFGAQASVSAALKYNNYRGFSRSLNGNVGWGGLGLGFSYETGRFKFSPQVNPIALAKKIISGVKKKNNKNIVDNEGIKVVSVEELYSIAYQSKTMKTNYTFNKSTPTFSVSPLKPISIQSSTPKYSGFSVNLSFEAGGDILPVPVDLSGKIYGSFDIQNYKDSQTKQVYGYFNNENASQGVMDYYNENENMFDKRDRYVGIPIASSDFFSFSGESISGSMRGFRSEIGHYNKDKVTTNTVPLNAGFDIALPSLTTIPPGILSFVQTYGGNVGGGYSSTTVGDWDEHQGNSSSYSFKQDNAFTNTTNEKIVFKFNGDKAGSFSQSGNENDSPIQANLNKQNSLGTNYELNLDNFNSSNNYINKRAPRSNYVSISKNKDFFEVSKNVRYKVHQKELFYLNSQTASSAATRQDDAINWVNYNTPNSNNNLRKNDDKIGEVVTYNTDGLKYVYGLPLNIYNQGDLQYSLYNDGNPKFSFQNYDGGKQNIIADVNQDFDVNKTDYKTGYEDNITFASQFLLTQITSPDYIDIKNDGLTPDDFGNYTRFNYKRTAGHTSKYNYRNPYQGVNFNFGSLSDDRDDKGSYSYGSKDLYYIHSISSKTHVAIFSTSDRQDGISANPNIIGGQNKDISLQKLDKIELFAINDCELIGTTGVYRPITNAKPIKTVHFEYDYSLCKNLPNNTINSGANSGKLTLKKIWFEYEGKVKNMISPYVFNYVYPAKGTYPSKYSTLQSEYESLTQNAQNPNYNPLNSNAWGYYNNFNNQYNHLANDNPAGQQDLAYFFPFVDQKNDNTVDPAAWCLKNIQLPSGGEIHIQYEQNEYQYVQDKRAMLMIPLDKNTDKNENIDNKLYYLDLKKTDIFSSLDIDVSDNSYNSTELDKLMSLANELFEPFKADKPNNRIYFNFLYKLIGDGAAPSYSVKTSEYIEGYAKIQSFGVTSDGKIAFSFSKDADYGTNGKSASIDHGKSIKEIEFPRNVCKQFYKSNRQGLLSTNSNALSTDNQSQGFLDAILSKFQQLSSFTSVCAVMSPTMSYVKVQLPNKVAKKGGGVRVKRILTYDIGLDSDQVLYGQEYAYVNEDNSSSGVATNEPDGIRKESPLVYPLDRDNQSKLDAAMYGDDIYDNEAPLGASLLPSASIAYSRIVIKNIHTGINNKTSQGYEVQEFYTCKDFPFVAYHTSLQKRLENPLGGIINLGFYNRCTPYITQGYSFISNDMHGKQKRIAKYIDGVDSPIYEQIIEYTKPGEAVAVMDKENKVTYDVIGRESETLAERREVAETGFSANVSMDYTFGVWIVFAGIGIFPLPIAYVSGINGDISGTEQILRTHVTTKITNYSAIIKKVTTKTDGIVHIAENLVFDKYTGNPVVNRSYDDFNKTYVTQDFMGSWSYENLGSKAENEGLIFENINVVVDKSNYDTYVELGQENCGLLEKFTTGDLIQLYNNNSLVNLYHISEIDKENFRLYLQKSSVSSGGLSTDRFNIKILRSGRTNQLTTKIGNLVAHNTNGPIVINSNSPQTNNDINTFVTLLNTKLNSIANPTSAILSQSSIILANEIPSNLQIVEPLSRNCVKGSDLGLDIAISKKRVFRNSKIREIATINLLKKYNNTTTSGTEYNGYIMKGSTQKITTCNSGSCFSITKDDGMVNSIGINPQSGAVWAIDKLNLNKNFDLTFKVNFGSNNDAIDPNTGNRVSGADGMAFVLHTDSKLPIGSAGASLGIMNSSSSSISRAFDGPLLGVEFDTYLNGYDKLVSNNSSGTNICSNPTSDYNFNDYPAGYTGVKCFNGPTNCQNQNDYPNCAYFNFDHINIFKDELNSSFPILTDKPVPAISQSITASNPFGSGEIEDGNFHDVRIKWDATNKGFEVYFDGILRKSFTNDIVNNVFNGTSNVYFGWTGSQALPNNQSVTFPSSFIGDICYSCGKKSSCYSELGYKNGTFSYDENSGYIIYTPTNSTCGKPVKCLKICSSVDRQLPTAGNIITASASTMSDYWSYNNANYTSLNSLTDLNDFETGKRGKWRIKDQYVYKTAINSGKNYEAGIFSDFSPFNWSFESDDEFKEINDPSWILASRVNSYTPNGQVDEDQNALGIKSTALFKDNQTLISAVAQNAALGTIYFNDFENSTGTTSTYHTGKKSLALVSGSNIGSLTISNQNTITRVWIKGLTSAPSINIGGIQQIMSPKAQIENWVLYEAELNTTLLVNQKANISFSFSGTNVFIDDLRCQPFSSEMVAYVYDNAHRIIASFDDKHYALIYQYNSEGLLIRKLKETTNGLKTISEQQYNSRKTTR